MRELTRQEVAAQVRFGPVANGRVVPMLLLVFASLGGLLALAWLTEEPLLLVLAGPLMFLDTAVYFAPPLLRMRRARLVVRGGTRALARVLRYRRIGSVGAYPANPLLEVTLELTTPEGEAVQAATRESGHRDPRIDEAMVGRELWVYWDPRYPDLAVPEERWQLSHG